MNKKIMHMTRSHGKSYMQEQFIQQTLKNTKTVKAIVKFDTQLIKKQNKVEGNIPEGNVLVDLVKYNNFGQEAYGYNVDHVNSYFNIPNVVFLYTPYFEVIMEKPMGGTNGR